MSNPLAGNFPAVLDACVLWPSSLRDTLLRLAEPPPQYVPKWTDQIWKEVVNSLERRGRCTPEQTRRLEEAIHAYFPESFVHGYEPLIAVAENDPKDRHVLAAAIRCQAQVIVTFNLRDFKREVLAP